MKNNNFLYGREITEIDWKINQKEYKLWAIHQGSNLHQADITAASFSQST